VVTDQHSVTRPVSTALHKTCRGFGPTCGKWQQFGVCNYSTCTRLTGTGLHISRFVLVLDSCAVLHEEIHISSKILITFSHILIQGPLFIRM